jgi:PEGA domain
MKNLSILILVVAITTLSCSDARYRSNSNRLSHRDLSLEARQIADERPELSYETLAADENAVTEAWPKIFEKLTVRGFSAEEAREVTLTSWRALRLKQLQAQEPLTAEALERYAGELGKLVIISTPPEADVEIDAQIYERKTNTAAWLSPGSYKIKVSKRGFEPVEKSYLVREGEKTQADFVLKQRQRQ